MKQPRFPQALGTWSSMQWVWVGGRGRGMREEGGGWRAVVGVMHQV